MKHHNIILELPINQFFVSGRISTLILRTLYEQEKNNIEHHNIFLFPTGQLDLSQETDDIHFNIWLTEHQMKNARENSNRAIPSFKIGGYLDDSLRSVSNKINFLSFHPFLTPNPNEIKLSSKTDLFFPSKFINETFHKEGINSKYLPMAFDSFTFHRKLCSPKNKIIFNLVGTHTFNENNAEAIRAWINKYKDNSKVCLNCSILNPYINQDNNNLIKFILGNNEKPDNVNFAPLPRNSNEYNLLLNDADIIIGMSNIESFAYPEFHSVALGKQAVLLKAHSYQDWATESMANWVNTIPNTFHLFDNEEFLAQCDKAIESCGQINSEGLKLAELFTKEKLVENIFKIIENE